MKVAVDFHPMFEKPMLSGKKRLTSRLKAKGQAGDVFEAFGKWFIIENVTRIHLGVVASSCWNEEGCRSRKHFIETWTKRIGHTFHEGRNVYAHRFRMLGEDVRFRGNDFWEGGMSTCLACGAAVFDEPVHIAFHEGLGRGGRE